MTLVSLRPRRVKGTRRAKVISSTPLRWDAHACLPLHPSASLEPLLRYHRAGVHYVSVNVGMDMNPLRQVMRTLAGFRASISRHPDLTLAGSLSDLRASAARGVMSVGFDLEGALPLLELEEMVDLYRALGVRQIHLAYNRNNSAASGCHDLDRGLTSLGERLVSAMNRAGVIMDGAHMSARACISAAEISATPIVISHANPRALVEHERNVTDDQISSVVTRDGVVCVSGVNAFLGEDEPSAERLLDHICYLAERWGAESVGVGLDVGFDEPEIDDTPPPPYDPQYWWPPRAGYGDGIKEIKYVQPELWSQLPDLLSARGMSPHEIDGVLGENMARVLDRVETYALSSAHPNT